MNNKVSRSNGSILAYCFFFAIFAIAFTLCAAFIAYFSFLLQGENQAIVGAFGQTEPRLTVIIDAGHGGEDGGAVSDSGICEKDLNLDIAKKLQDLLMLSDVNIVMTRQSDILLYSDGQQGRKKFYDITNRINIASSYDSAILISIHQNKFPIRKYSGFQVYYSKNNANSKKLATIVKDNVKNHLQPQNKREIKAADENIRLLDSIQVPAILAECGFLSNENEANLLNTAEYRNKIAYLIYISIMEYVKET